MNRSMVIYGNWSAYDELSDGVPLTEELAMRQFAELLRLRSLGVRFDAYLMDAFWFDPDGGYRTWRKPNWPDGPRRWLDACAENDVVPGLWFTANTLCHLKPAAAWLDSADASGWGLCCFHGGFLADYLDVLDFWYREGIRIFKFDFADFTAAPPSLKESMTPEVIRCENESSFLDGLIGFRSAHPEALLMGFNGFERKDYMDRTDRPLEPVLDLKWLRVFDSLYSGDPRPADVPTMPFWRSLDIYADHTTRVLLNSGVPAGQIDNCGFMAGPTGTCYWRGKAMWKSMLLLTLVRGGDLTVLYGDLSQFDEADGRWIARAQSLFGKGGEVTPIGGIPGRGEPYGWLFDNRLCAMVNPMPTPAVILAPLTPWHLLFRDSGFEPRFDGTRGWIELGPYQFALLGSEGPDLGVQEDCTTVVRSSVEFKIVEESSGKLTVETVGGNHHLIVQHRDAAGKPVRMFSGLASAASAVSVRARQGRNELTVVRHDDRVIWSGMSWAIAQIDAPLGKPVQIEITATDPHVESFEISIWNAGE